jgi:hypothetical protein
LFPRIPLGFSSGLGAFGATPETPHLEYLDTLGESPNLKSLINNKLFTPHRVAHQHIYTLALKLISVLSVFSVGDK